jgi:hypothetical protein
MKTYKVIITEKLQMEVEVEARCRFEAERIVKKDWDNSEFILDSDHFKGVTFRAEIPNRNRDNAR